MRSRERTRGWVRILGLVALTAAGCKRAAPVQIQQLVLVLPPGGEAANYTVRLRPLSEEPPPATPTWGTSRRRPNANTMSSHGTSHGTSHVCRTPPRIHVAGRSYMPCGWASVSGKRASRTTPHRPKSPSDLSLWRTSPPSSAGRSGLAWVRWRCRLSAWQRHSQTWRTTLPVTPA